MLLKCMAIHQLEDSRYSTELDNDIQNMHDRVYKIGL